MTELPALEHAAAHATEDRLPQITLVTPSYNQGRFLEQTLKSVIDQEYPRLEYFVYDGGSTDASVSIIKRYERRLAHWESRPDGGQADAIYRGFERASGNVIGWLNSDDLLLPGSLLRWGREFAQHPETDLIVGGGFVIDEHSTIVTPKWSLLDYFYPSPTVSFSEILSTGHFYFLQPASLWRRDAFFRVGGFDRRLQFCFDLDMYLRLTAIKPARAIPEPLAAFRVHPLSKTSTLEAVRLREREALFAARRLPGGTGTAALLKGYFTVRRFLRHKLRLAKHFVRPREVVLPSPIRAPGQAATVAVRHNSLGGAKPGRFK